MSSNMIKIKFNHFCLTNLMRNSHSRILPKQISGYNTLQIFNNPSSFNSKQISPSQIPRISLPQVQWQHPDVKLFCSVTCPRCWSCHSEFNKWERFCPDCSKIQPLNDLFNYYEVLGIQQQFSVEVSILTRKFRALQGVYHPDKFSLKSKEEQELSAECSSMLNKAYRALLHPMTRAEYFLHLAGRTLQEEEMSLDQEFLLTIMELNEELSEAEGKEAVQKLGKKNKATLDALLRDADEAFQNSDMDRARDVVARLKYYENIYNKVRDYEREHGIVD